MDGIVGALGLVRLLQQKEELFALAADFGLGIGTERLEIVKVGFQHLARHKQQNLAHLASVTQQRPQFFVRFGRANEGTAAPLHHLLQPIAQDKGVKLQGAQFAQRQLLFGIGGHIWGVVAFL